MDSKLSSSELNLQLTKILYSLRHLKYLPLISESARDFVSVHLDSHLLYTAKLRERFSDIF